MCSFARIIMVVVGLTQLTCSSGPPREPVTPPLPPLPPPPPSIPSPPPAPPAPTAPPMAERLELTFAGDVMFGGVFHDIYRGVEVPTHDPFVDVHDLLASDLAVVNLETTVVATVPPGLTGHLRFAATPDQAALLPRHGIRAVSIANNHANDLGDDGVAQTPVHLAALGVTPLGAAIPDRPGPRVETMEVSGWRIGFISATSRLNRKQAGDVPRIPWMWPEELTGQLVPLVEQARVDHDLVIVLVHWGNQLADQPEQWQVDVGHALVDAGAAAVIGHHPHVLQGIERYRGGVIAYSLGNFVFRNTFLPQRFTGVLRLAYARDRRCLDLAVFHPAVMRGGDVYHPEPAQGRTFDEIAARVTRLSDRWPLDPTWWITEEDRLVTAGACHSGP